MVKKIAKKNRSRAKYKCPPMIENLIQMANDMPVNPSLPTHEEYEKGFRPESKLKEPMTREEWEDLIIYSVKRLMNDTISLHEDAAVSAYKEALEPNPAWDSLVEKEEAKFYVKFAAFYESIVTNLKTFIQVVQIVDGVRTGKIDKSDIPPIQISVRPKIKSEREESDETLTIKSPTVIDVLNGTYNRLRICEICKNIFWAERIDKKACSLDCANNLRVRRYRSLSDDEKAKRKTRATANRERNKELKIIKMEKKKNGNL